jgi:hypothetical protein
MKNSDLPAMPVSEKIDDQVIAQAKASGVIIKHEIQHQGLTKREHFAAMAMQGMLANTDMMKVVIHSDEFASPWDDFAAQAVQQSDALLAALEES